ncbi:LysR substrate-binding domain-containing protein [Roseovarius indicus]|uniref:LysR substrate-binding domain-containing protein n=1 Tax=Roseovarius indicus TaxID=540747 RepID=UPI0007D90C24|nr:LysR substrate-binding domain-containing protein [Roseovarius indicus]OAO07089.1 transcriptional regulator [Roseovarius indicus]
MRQFINLQTDLLRTFVTVVDLGNYTETGTVLGRTQPAISLQIKRLEELAEAKLLSHKGRQVDLTPEGQALLGYAREILRLNDRAVATLHQKKSKGILRIGLPIDYSTNYFQKIIADFSRANPDVMLDIRCDWSKDLLNELHSDDLDVALAVTDAMPAPYVSLYWSERPVWAGSRHLKLNRKAPVNLIAHPEGCYYRKRMIDTLNIEGREWRIAFESPGISALQNAVLEGMGVSALTKKTLLPGMRILEPKEGFLALANIHIGLFYKHVKLSDAALKLIEEITTAVRSFQSPTSTRAQ